MSSGRCLLRIRNARQVVRVCRAGEPFKVGKDMDNVELLEDASIVVGLSGNIEAVGPTLEIENMYKDTHFETDLDATGRAVLPGFIDAHTHPVWAGDRVHEFAMKLAGATYMDIHKMGGGIGFTVEHTRRASPEELKNLLLGRLDRMLRFGTTTVEAKSGYGLDVENEMKMLQVLHEANKEHPIEIISTFLGAHSIPKGSTAAEATEDVINKQLPALLVQFWPNWRLILFSNCSRKARLV